MAGYSATPLGKKLGLKPGMRALFIAAPPTVLATLASDLREVTRVRAGTHGCDFVHWFVPDAASLARDFSKHQAALAPAGTFWISWRKGGAKAVPPCDVGESDIRAAALATDLVDVKICAVDETWSGLKLVYRLSARSRVATK